MVAVPLFPPLQLTLAVALVLAERAAGWLTITAAVAGSLFASVTVIVYVPDVRLLIEVVVAPVLHE